MIYSHCLNFYQKSLYNLLTHKIMLYCISWLVINFREIKNFEKFPSDSPYQEWPACGPGTWRSGLWHAAYVPIACARVLCPDLPPRPVGWLFSLATIRRRWRLSRARSRRNGTPSHDSADHRLCWGRNQITLFGKKISMMFTFVFYIYAKLRVN